MKKITKKIIAFVLALSLGMLGSGFTSHAVNVTKIHGKYQGVVSLTRYKSGNVKKVKNGKAIKCVLAPGIGKAYTYNASTNSVSLASNKQSYTLKSLGYEIQLGNPKGYVVRPTISGYK